MNNKKKAYVVWGEVLLPFVVQIEAESEEDAIDKVGSMHFRDLNVSKEDPVIEVTDVYKDE